MGGLLLIFGGLQDAPMVSVLTQSDWIGLGMALLATFTWYLFQQNRYQD